MHILLDIERYADKYIPKDGQRDAYGLVAHRRLESLGLSDSLSSCLARTLRPSAGASATKLLVSSVVF